MQDFGPLLPDEIRAFKVPHPRITRDVRLPVAFDLLRLHAQRYGGFYEYVPRHEEDRVCLFAYGFQKNRLTRTRLAFRQFIELTSPEDLQTIAKEYIGLENHSPSEQPSNPTLHVVSTQRSECGLRMILRLLQGDMDCLLSMRSHFQQQGMSRITHSRDIRIQLEQVGGFIPIKQKYVMCR